MTDLTSPAKLVTVFGGSGFVGRHIVQALARRGYRVRAAVRRPDLAGHLQPLGSVGQITSVQANLRYRWSVERALQGADAVINAVGILYEAGRQSFDAVQTFGPRAIGEAAREAGISNVVHISAIGADSSSEIDYLRSKGLGESGVLEAVPDATIMRPSVIFGPEDNFFNKFAGIAQISPVLPLIGGGGTKFQPVYVGNVAEAVAVAIEGNAKPGAIYELGGPDVATFRQCLELVLEETGRKRALVPIPFGTAKIMGRIMGFLPKPLLTADQVQMLRSDTIVSDAAKADGRTLAGLGVKATAMDVILPAYLVRFREHGQFESTRTT